jgi:4-cresol dehydrogenase (hydroxylating) flavoprotein subunit
MKNNTADRSVSAIESMKVADLALAELRKIVGADNVLTDPNLIAEYERATFATSQRIPLVILPGSTEEVKDIVRIANQYRLRLYPISRGRNWGFGSRVPVESGCCIVDLKRMNRILEFDENSAVITVEPGVTFEQAAAFLQEKKSSLYLTVTGGPPEGSVLANALERGAGVGPLGDRAKYCNGLEVVLPTGEIIHTGCEAFANSRVGKIAQFGLGPSIDGLFFQSNFGIVTKMSVWLARKPNYFQLLFFAAYNEQEMMAASSAIRELQQQGVVRDTSFSLWNVYRFLTAQIQYPWEAFGGRVGSPKELLEYLPKSWKGVQWVGFVGLYSPSFLHAISSRLLVRRALRHKVSRFFIIDPMSANIGRLFQEPLHRMTGVDVRKMLEATYFHSVFLGHPTRLSTGSAYWRKRGPAPITIDPDRDRCGLHWIDVALPFNGEDIIRVTRTVEDVAIKYRLEPMANFFNMNQWYMKSFIVIMFDQDVPGEEDAARQCHDELFATLNQLGYSPIRLGIQSMGLGAPTEQTYVELVRRLKQMLDPNDILSPGRYDFRQRWSSSIDNVQIPH